MLCLCAGLARLGESSRDRRYDACVGAVVKAGGAIHKQGEKSFHHRVTEKKSCPLPVYRAQSSTLKEEAKKQPTAPVPVRTFTYGNRLRHTSTHVPDLPVLLQKPGPPLLPAPVLSHTSRRTTLAITTEHIRRFLGPDGVLQQEMLLPAWLHQHELLRLSEAASWLVPYRTQLASIRVMGLGRPGRPADPERLTAMVAAQRRLCTVRVLQARRLQATLEGLGQSRVNGSVVHTLDLGRCEGLDHHGAEVVATMMKREACPLLETLRVNGNFEIGRRGAEAIAGALAEGAATRLKCLNLFECQVWVELGT
jgi:hypothetical protein